MRTCSEGYNKNLDGNRLVVVRVLIWFSLSSPVATPSVYGTESMGLRLKNIGCKTLCGYNVD